MGSCLDRPTAREPDAQQCRTDCSDDEDCAEDEICLEFVNEEDELTAHCTTECTDGGEEDCSSDEDCFKVDADRFGCLGDKTEKYLGYQETILGKGYQPLVDTAELVARTGGRLEIHVNATTDSPESAAELVQYTLERQLPVSLWVLAMETFYFRATSSPPVLWQTGWDYSSEMRGYVSAIEDAYATHNAALPEGSEAVTVPPISISFSDAENEWQRVWDVGKEPDPLLSDSKPGISDELFSNGAVFTAIDSHWYVGDPSSTLDEAYRAANHQLVEDLAWNIDNWFLELGSDENLRPTMVFTEYNIQTTWRTALAMVHAAEFVDHQEDMDPVMQQFFKGLQQRRDRWDDRQIAAIAFHERSALAPGLGKEQIAAQDKAGDLFAAFAVQRDARKAFVAVGGEKLADCAVGR